MDFLAGILIIIALYFYGCAANSFQMAYEGYQFKQWGKFTVGSIFTVLTIAALILIAI